MIRIEQLHRSPLLHHRPHPLSVAQLFLLLLTPAVGSFLLPVHPSSTSSKTAVLYSRSSVSRRHLANNNTAPSSTTRLFLFSVSSDDNAGGRSNKAAAANITTSTRTTVDTKGLLAELKSKTDPNNQEVNAASSTSTSESTSSTSTGSSSTSSASSSSSPPGIGGLGGIVYDVNKLKRNLLQETIRAYKNDLLELLSSPRTTERDVTYKLGALVQGSAVRTTTDSNLLDNSSTGSIQSGGGGVMMSSSSSSDNRDDAGGPWTLAYTSRYTRLDDLYQPIPVETRRQRRKRRQRGGSSSSSSQNGEEAPLLSPAEKRRGGKQAITSTRFMEFHLEGDVLSEQPQQAQTVQASGGALSSSPAATGSYLASTASAPYTLDTTQYCGGLLCRQERWKVDGLTRTNLILAHDTTTWFFLGRPYYQQSVSSSSQSRKNVQVVYLDVNLAVLAETTVDNSLSATTKSLSRRPSTQSTNIKSPKYQVFTKNPAWSDSYTRRKRKWRLLLDTIQYWIWNNAQHQQQLLLKFQSNYRSPEEEVDRILQELQLDTSSRLRVLKLGQISPASSDNGGSSSSSSSTSSVFVDDDDNLAWDGPSDPFVHLSADERQELLKQMKIRDVEQAGYRQVAKSKRQQNILVRLFQKRRSWFRKPPPPSSPPSSSSFRRMR